MKDKNYPKFLEFNHRIEHKTVKIKVQSGLKSLREFTNILKELIYLSDISYPLFQPWKKSNLVTDYLNK